MVSNVCNRLFLLDRLIHLYQAFNKAAIRRQHVVEGGDNIGLAKIWFIHIGVVGRDDAKVIENTVDEVKTPVDQALIPYLSLSHLDCDSGYLVVHKSCFDTSWLSHINLEGVWLE